MSPVRTMVGALLVLAAGCEHEEPPPALFFEDLFNSNLLLSGDRPFDDQGMTQVVDLPAPPRGVVALWEAMTEETRLHVRFRHAGGWSGWQAVAPYWREQTLAAGRVQAPAGADALQLRHVGPPPSSVIVEPVEAPEAASADLWLRKTMTSTLPPFVKPRSEWSAKPPQASMTPMTPERVTIHHTASSNATTQSPEVQLRGWQSFHMGKGWSDIGYHFLVDPTGQLWQGRDLDYQGAHVGNHNKGNVGVSFMGTYTTHQPSAAQIKSVGRLIAWLASSFAVSVDTAHVKGHRDFPGHETNECPGDMLHARIPELITAAKNGDTPPPPPPIPTSPELTGQVLHQDTGAAVPGARVSVEGQDEVTSDDAGRWTMGLPVGSYTVTGSASGFEPTTATCEVVQGIANNPCELRLRPTAAPDPAPSPPPAADTLQGGCQLSAGGSPSPVMLLLLGLLLMGLFVARARH
jgi:hypothetical protein